MLTAAILTSYVLAATAFYWLSAKSAFKVGESGTTFPHPVPLTVVEGGLSAHRVMDRAA